MSITMPPDIVIRPAGVWNSRAPFHNFLAGYRQLNRSYSRAVLASFRIKRDLKKEEGFSSSIRRYFVAKEGKTEKDSSTAAWQAYRRTFGKIQGGADLRQPQLTDVVDDLENVISALRKSSVINHIGLFELFLQCWTLNYLLAKIEASQLWSNEERILATKLSPVHGGEAAPGLNLTIRCLPEVKRGLRSIAPFFKQYETMSALEKPPKPELSALAVLDFWITIRNVLVHRGGWISVSTAEKCKEVWNWIFRIYNHIPEIKPGRPLVIHHEMVQSVALTVYRSCLWLSDFLEEISGGRRGHPFAPGPKPDGWFDGSKVSAPPMLLDGDHALSLEWGKG